MEKTKEINGLKKTYKLNNKMLQKGDKYIHFTKYGGVNKGEVYEVFSNLTSIDTKNKVYLYH